LVTHRRLTDGIVGRAELHSSLRAKQNMGMPATTQRWTRDEVLDLIARNPLTTPRYELVDGELLVTPSPSGPHQFAVAIMLQLLGEYLAGEPGVGEVLTSPADVMLDEGRDVLVPIHERRHLDAIVTQATDESHLLPARRAPRLASGCRNHAHVGRRLAVCLRASDHGVDPTQQIERQLVHGIQEDRPARRQLECARQERSRGHRHRGRGPGRGLKLRLVLGAADEDERA
jgi:hypothetical protein